MQLAAALIRLPLRFDADALAAEIAAVPESTWRPHPEGHPGNSALPLVSLGGDPNDDGVRGPMRPTPVLDQLPTVRAVLAAFDVPVGRTRLMRLDGDAEATPHVDVNYYWLNHTRIHVPVVTTPGVRFVVGDVETHMAAGEAWVFDTWRRHNVVNPDPTRRIHLVVDTVGSASFWDLVDGGEIAEGGAMPPSTAPVVQLDASRPITFETVNHPVVMAPVELDAMVDWITRQAPANDDVGRTLTALQRDWRATWARHGDRPDGHADYRALIDRATRALAPHAGKSQLANGSDVVETFHHAVAAVAVAAPGAPVVPVVPVAASAPSEVPLVSSERSRIARPVFIVSAPRSGSTLLFETLAQSPDLWTIGGESHELIEGIAALSPAAREWDSNVLDATDATPETVSALIERFEGALQDRRGNRPGAHLRGLTLLEKTPKNALRVPFLARAFPDARFVYLYRDPVDTMASMLEGWRSGRFVTYPDLPGWPDPPWSFLLVPGWRELIGQPVREIVARQWAATTDRLLDDLEALAPQRWCVASYGRLVEAPQEEIVRLCRFLGVRWDRELTAPLPLSRYTVTPPDAAKTARNGREIEAVLPIASTSSERARAVFASPPGRARAVGAPTAPAQIAQAPRPNDASGFGSQFTASLVELLQSAGITIAVTTYQSGRLILLRADNGAVNTHFRVFDSPMGIAVVPGQLVIGTRSSVVDYRNQPAVAPKLDPPGKHDAAYLPRSVHITGDIRVHDVDVVGGEIWVVNTSFSCLATIDRDHSFVPRWRPPFVTALTAEDRCHLNGMAVVDGRPRYVTAFGETDTVGGWRENKAFGGVVIDVDSGETVVRNLCMPHSPRWHDGKLWLLESGKGTLATADVTTGEVTSIAHLPGFTRGLAFVGKYALVGLSLVRESLFDGVPVVGRDDLACGVWVVDTTTGAIAAFVRFSGTVQEIFDVAVLPHRFPDVTEGGDPRIATSFVVPDSALKEVPAQLRG